MDRYAMSGTEPPLSEVLDDPIVRLVMARDNVGRDDLERMIETHRGHRAADLPKTGGPVGGGAERIPLWFRFWAGCAKRIHG